MGEREELLPCPFCGSTRLESGGDDKFIGVRCLNCEAVGPNHYGKFEWDHRAPAQSAPVPTMQERDAALIKSGESRTPERAYFDLENERLKFALKTARNHLITLGGDGRPDPSADQLQAAILDLIDGVLPSNGSK